MTNDVDKDGTRIDNIKENKFLTKNTKRDIILGCIVVYIFYTYLLFHLFIENILKINKETYYWLLIIPSVFLIIILVPIAFYFKANSDNKEKMLIQLFSELGFEYNKSPLDCMWNTSLFYADQSEFGNSFTGIINNVNTKIYNCDFTYSNGSGNDKSPTAVYYVVFTAILDNISLPHIFIKSNNMGPLCEGFFKSVHELNFNNSFTNNFSVWVEDDFQIEAYQILTTDFLELLLSKYKDYSIELFGNKIFLIKKDEFTSKQEYVDSFGLYKDLINNLKDKVTKLSKDVEAMQNIIKPPVSEIYTGKRPFEIFKYITRPESLTIIVATIIFVYVTISLFPEGFFQAFVDSLKR